MERQQEDMKYLGPCGIIGESSKMISKRKKIFTKIALSILIILTFIVSLCLGFEFIYKKNDDKQSSDKSSPSDKAISWVFKVTFTLLTRLLLFFPTAGVAYVVACVYTGRGQEFLTFRKILRFLPKVWKRLTVTFLWVALVTYVSNIIFAALIIFLSGVHGVAQVIIYLVYGIGLAYMTIIWELAYVVAVLEDAYGLAAMRKSYNLIKGKRWTIVGLYLFVFLFIVGIVIMFTLSLAVHSLSVGLIIGLGVLALFLLVVLFLFSFVMQTVLYFVCKSYHDESIDKLKLSDHLEVSEGEHSGLNAVMKILTCCSEQV